MTKSCERFTALRLTTPFACGLLLAAATGAFAAASDASHITQLANHVEIVPKHGASHAATTDEQIPQDSVVQTGNDSHVELTFDDSGFARLGGSTTFRTDSGQHVSLATGSVLLHVTKSSGEHQLQTSLVTLFTSGATFAVETHKFPAGFDRRKSSEFSEDARYRVSVLEGSVRLCCNEHPEECVTIGAKQAIIGSATTCLGTVVKFEIAQWMQTNVLITGFAPMNSAILAAIGVSGGSSALAAFARPAGVDAGNIYAPSIGTINPANLSDGGNEVSPSQERLTIRHSGQTITLPREVAEAHLEKHPGDCVGACE